MTKKEKAELFQLTKHYKENHRVDTERSLDCLRAAISEADTVRAVSAKKPLTARKRFWSPWKGVAAALLFLLVGAASLWWSQDGSRRYAAEDSPLEVRLADGTFVLLKPGSELEILPEFGNQSRAVVLRGEAFFDVVQDPQRPFSVCQEEVCMRVLGTSFNLLCEPGAKLMEVEVASGKVLMATATDSVVVLAKEFARFSAAVGWEEGSASNLNRHAWRTKKLYFDAEQLSVVLDLVSRAYGEKITTSASSLQQCDFPLTASFEALPLEELLSDLSRLAGGYFEKNLQNGTYELLDWCR